MKYFLSSIVDVNLQGFIRDLKQKLKKQQRNIEFRDLQILHFDYKFLGADLSKETTGEIFDALRHYVSQRKIRPFTMPLSVLRFGHKSELSPDKLYIKLKHDQYFNQFTTEVNQLIAGLNIPDLSRPKDRNNLLGIIKLGTVKSGISRSDYAQIDDIISSVELPKEVEINNFTILKTGVKQRKVIFRTVGSVNI